MERLPRLDICCGARPAEGYLGVDIWPAGEEIRYANLDKRWPFDDNSVGVIRAVDALEHLHDPLHTMNEIWRVLAPGGWLLSMTPSTDGRGAFQDPTHVSWWNENSWWYWTHRNFHRYLPQESAAPCFQAVRLQTLFPTDWHRANNIPYVLADLVALKEGYRAPGRVEI